MIPLKISLEKSQGVTVISNLFIDKYMEEANDAQIKLYLYLLRMIGSNLPTDISEMADKFNYTEKDVEKALKYWEKKELLSLDFAENKISGIVIRDIAGPCTGQEKARVSTSHSDMIVTEEVQQDIPMIKMNYELEKEKYSIEDIQRIKSEPEVKMLLGVAQEYFKVPMNPASIRTIVFIYDRLDFSFDLIDFLLERCVLDNKKNTAYLEQLAKYLYEQGIKDKEEAKVAIDQIVPYYVPKVMGFLNIEKKAIPAQVEYIKRWIMDYGFSLEVIERACAIPAMREMDEPFSYVEKVLLDWKENNIHTPQEADNYNQKYRDERNAEKQKRAEQKSEARSDMKKSYGPSVTSSPNGKSDFCTMKSRAYDVEKLMKAAKVN